MFLTEIDKSTGLVIISKSKDGVLAIKEFRDVINNPELGIECFTAIALTADYLSPKRFYDENDRPRAAMEEVTGDRDKFVWKREEIQKALIKYDQLQYDSDVVEIELHKQRKNNVLKKIKEAEKLSLEEQMERNLKISSLTSSLRKINEDIKAFYDRTSKDSLYSNSPVENGYSLSRLEQKLKKKNSHYNLQTSD